jgi:hypothetical protein
VWLADHDLDEPGGGQDLISIYSGRGILSESAGPGQLSFTLVWRMDLIFFSASLVDRYW